MAGLYDQLHNMINHPIKYESYQTNDLRGAAFTYEVGQIKERTDEQTDKLINYMPTHTIVRKA